jgi:hypothetical protein
MIMETQVTGEVLTRRTPLIDGMWWTLLSRITGVLSTLAFIVMCYYLLFSNGPGFIASLIVFTLLVILRYGCNALAPGKARR